MFSFVLGVLKFATLCIGVYIASYVAGLSVGYITG